MTARVAVVTGASSGIGLGITRALLERGYRVVANSRTISDSKDLQPSASLVLVDGDIAKKATATKVADAAVQHFERIDLLVNNAGIYLPKPFREYTPEDFERMISTNVAGYFFVTQQAVAADGIRANTISPGVVDTPMHTEDDHEFLKKLHLIPRLVQISEIVDALLYLESAPMVNGENIRIDGGAHAGAKW